jgi:hypothetical protein
MENKKIEINKEQINKKDDIIKIDKTEKNQIKIDEIKKENITLDKKEETISF